MKESNIIIYLKKNGFDTISDNMLSRVAKPIKERIDEDMDVWTKTQTFIGAEDRSGKARFQSWLSYDEIRNSKGAKATEVILLKKIVNDIKKEYRKRDNNN